MYNIYIGIYITSPEVQKKPCPNLLTADKVKAGPLKGNFIRSCADAVDDGRMVQDGWYSEFMGIWWG